MKLSLAWNIWIMANYGGAILWWLWHGSRVDAFYWLCALGITATVTFGYGR